LFFFSGYYLIEANSFLKFSIIPTFRSIVIQVRVFGLPIAFLFFSAIFNTLFSDEVFFKNFKNPIERNEMLYYNAILVYKKTIYVPGKKHKVSRQTQRINSV